MWTLTLTCSQGPSIGLGGEPDKSSWALWEGKILCAHLLAFILHIHSTVQLTSQAKVRYLQDKVIGNQDISSSQITVNTLMEHDDTSLSDWASITCWRVKCSIPDEICIANFNTSWTLNGCSLSVLFWWRYSSRLPREANSITSRYLPTTTQQHLSWEGKGDDDLLACIHTPNKPMIFWCGPTRWRIITSFSNASLEASPSSPPDNGEM